MIGSQFVKKITNSCGRIISVLVLAVVAITTVAVYEASEHASENEAQWGSQVTEGDEGYSVASEVSDGIIPPANACGLGASSCYQCHDGVRAEFEADAKWHEDHEDVNHSCEGCHAGNPRMQQEDMAHDGMREDPMESIDASCAECHEGGELERYREAY